MAGKGERLHIVFQDGTKVFLNSGSTLTYPECFSISNRKVSLNGEAYFDVAHYKNKDFEVMLGDKISVKVLGTEFIILKLLRTIKMCL